jgi:hypothetical protein
MIRLLNKFLQLKVEQLTKPPADTSVERLFNCIKSIEEGSNKISTWSLSTVGGSLLAILSNEYLHPPTAKLKMIYLLFILGWLFIGISFYNGKNITSRTIASELNKNNKELLTTIFTDCNTYYSRQLRFFNFALLVFGIWLLLFLLWWVFGDSIINIIN